MAAADRLADSAADRGLRRGAARGRARHRREVAAALQGTPATRTRRTRDGRAVVMSAAHPIWIGDAGGRRGGGRGNHQSAMSLRSAALERLLLLTLAAFAGAGVGADRVRDAAVGAHPAPARRGRVGDRRARPHPAPRSRLRAPRDEIGDLSRSFSAVLERLAQHHAYLESMAGRLSHELRTPIAVVRSSLENLKLAPGRRYARYIERAEEGLAAPQPHPRAHDRGDAARAEPARRRARALRPGARWCAAASRAIASPTRRREFALALPRAAHGRSRARPTLLAQMLDKLVENAVDFSRAGRAGARLARRAAATRCSRSPTRARRSPTAMRGRLFDSMVSVREASAPAHAAPRARACTSRA